MEEEKKIMEKRSSFRGWKERNKDKIHQKKRTKEILIILSIFLVMMYTLGGTNNDVSKDKGNKTNKAVDNITKNKTTNPEKQGKQNISLIKKNDTEDTNTQNIIGKIGVPVNSKNGFEITVKSISSTELRTTAWIIVRNKDKYKKPFKLGSDTIILDNLGQQYENIDVKRSAEISQTDLAPQAMREGAIFFERLKDGRKPKNLTLNINNEQIDFILDQ